MNLEDKDFEKFIEQIQIEGFLCLPAVCTEKNYQLEFFERKGSFRMQFADQKVHLTEMPYLELYSLYTWCGRKFNTALLSKIFYSYAKEYEKALITDQKEQELFAGILNEFPEQCILSVLLPLSVLEGRGNDYPGRRLGNVMHMYALLLEAESDIRESWDCQKSVIGETAPADDARRIVLVTKQMMDKWGIGEGELLNAGNKNTISLFPYDLKKIEVLSEEDIFIVSNTSRFLGLGTLLCEEGPLKELSINIKSDFWVLPLSVHEAAVFSVEGMIAERQLEDIAEMVSPFGKQIWRYNSKLNRIAFTKEERASQELLLKPGLLDAAEGRMMNGTNR